MTPCADCGGPAPCRRCCCAHRGDGLDPPTRPARRPCEHRPGSEGKIAELRRRVRDGETLWHPGDAPGEE